jgi:hypothetical protein
VLIGAFATTGSQFFLEKKREEREDDRAKQLIAGELLHIQIVFRSVSKGRDWPPIEDIDARRPR